MKSKAFFKNILFKKKSFYKPPARLITEREKDRNERAEIIAKSIYIKKLIREYNEQLYTNNLTTRKNEHIP